MAMPTEELFQWFAGELAEERATLAPWLDLPLSSSLVGQKCYRATKETRHQALLKDGLSIKSLKAWNLLLAPHPSGTEPQAGCWQVARTCQRAGGCGHV